MQHYKSLKSKRASARALRMCVRAILCAGLFACACLAAPLRADHRMTVAVYDYPPYGYVKSDGKKAGVFIDLIQTLSLETGITLETRMVPIARALQESSDGTVDLLISYRDPVMAEGVRFVGDFACARELLVPNPGQMLKTPTDSAGLVVGYLIGGYFDKKFKRKKGFGISGPVPMVRMLLANRVDAIAMSDWVLDTVLLPPIKYQVEDSLMLQKMTETKPLVLKEFYVSLSTSEKKAEHSHQQQLTRGINAMREKGLIKEILARNGVVNGHCSAPPKP